MAMVSQHLFWKNYGSNQGLRRCNVVVAMTETGDVKQSLPVIDQSNLWERLSKAFDTGRGSVRVLVVNDHGREMAVDMKVLHGSSL